MEVVVKDGVVMEIGVSVRRWRSRDKAVEIWINDKQVATIFDGVVKGVKRIEMERVTYEGMVQVEIIKLHL